MNQRVVVIVLVALFATCFVGTGAIATLMVIRTAFEGIKDEPVSVVPPPEADEATTDPKPDEDLATAAPEVAPEGDEELTPPDEDEEALDEPAEFAPPLIATAEFAVFHVDKAKLDPWAALQKAAKGTKVKVFAGEAPVSASPPYLELRDLSVDDYAVIAGTTLENGRGLSDQVKAALPNAKRVSVLDSVMPLGQLPLLEVSKVMATFAQLTGGVLWDEEAQEYLSTVAWKQRRIDSWEKGVPHASMNFTVFVTTVPKGVELATSGMRHLGLPELELKNISRSSRDEAVSLVNATAQVLAERKGAPGVGPLKVSLSAMRHKQHRKNLEEKVFKNAERSVDVMLVPGGSGKFSTLEITFPGEGSPTERVEAGIAALFGSADRVDKVNHDEELTKLSQQQLEIYKTSIKKRFRKGLQYGEVLLVKAPFETTSGGNEWMWVEVSKLGAGGRIEGLLANDPDDVPSLQSGSEVTVNEAELFDWMIQEADGGTTGNETGKAMEQRRDE